MKKKYLALWLFKITPWKSFHYGTNIIDICIVVNRFKGIIYGLALTSCIHGSRWDIRKALSSERGVEIRLGPIETRVPIRSTNTSHNIPRTTMYKSTPQKAKPRVSEASRCIEVKSNVDKGIMPAILRASPSEFSNHSMKNWWAKLALAHNRAHTPWSATTPRVWFFSPTSIKEGMK